MSKLLITSGCSFSECITVNAGKGTWPNHLAKMLPDYKHVSYAMGSQGNGLISRGIIYGVCEALKTHSPNEILVGVMWSGSSRHDYRCHNLNDLEFLQNKVTPRKFNNIVEYLQSPGSNSEALAAAFTLFLLLHDLKLDILRQLDLRDPGHEGWVMATPAGYAKAVNRFDFTARNKAQNNPQQG